jgi:hypothetical protein
MFLVPKYDRRCKMSLPSCKGMCPQPRSVPQYDHAGLDVRWLLCIPTVCHQGTAFYPRSVFVFRVVVAVFPLYTLNYLDCVIVTQCVLREVRTELLFTMQITVRVFRALSCCQVSAVLRSNFCCNIAVTCVSALTFRLPVYGPWALFVRRCINSVCVDCRRRSFLKDRYFIDFFLHMWKTFKLKV